jgi:hypothetical protein
MLVDDMRRVRKRMVGEGVRVIGKEGMGMGMRMGLMVGGVRRGPG